MEMLRNLFADKLVVDDREPIWTFQFGEEEGQYWGLLAPKARLWQQLILLLMIQTAFQCFFAVVNYHLIVKQARRTTTAYLIGWGIVVPMAVYFPYWMLEFWELQSRPIKMSTGSSAYIVGFRTIEAMYDTSPHSVEATLTNYCAYYTSLMHFDWDPKTATRRKITAAELIKDFGMLMLFLHLLSVLLSFELHCGFQPFQSPVRLEEFHFNTDLLSPGHLANAYCLALTVYLTLSFGFRLTAFGEHVKGYRTQPIFHNPLFASRSPSEFWGKRWNLTIHRILKHGAFLPARHFVSTNLAVLWTFVVSGLIHDYAWSLTFYHHRHTLDPHTGQCLDCFAPILWKLTAFFAWNGCVMLLERPVGRFLHPYTQHVPTVVVSTLVVLTALPVSHWYSGDWAAGGYFADLSLGVWQIRRLPVSTSSS